MNRVPAAVLFAILFVLAFAIALSPAGMSQKAVPEPVATGRRIFNQSCAACHDTTGTTTKSGPGLKNYDRHQPHRADATMRTIIQQGKGKMPGFTTLGKTQIDDLVAYLKTL